MKKLVLIMLISTALIFGTGIVKSADALTIDPTTGGSGQFYWYGGLGDSVEFPSDDYLEITVGTASYIDLITVDDCCVVGDAFGLVLDGVLTSWTTDGFTGPGGLYEADAVDLFLTAGTHTIDLTVTADCCGAGMGYWSVSSVTAVPEPGTLLLLGSGLVGLTFARRRMK